MIAAGGRLSAARGSRDQDQPPGERRQFGDDRGKAQFRSGNDLARDLPKDGRTAELLLEVVGAVTGKPRDLVGEIDVPRLFELFDLMLGRDLIEHRLETIVGEDVELDPLHVSPDSEGGLLAGNEMQV